ncbi:GTP pyrophosphokinase [Aquimarina sp. 2304DJ70-9]|uniref:GTP pyrophosphokinase n=1 Tax=Aquimarina penaris TaxID=3231044 RepID=UPI00346259C5
MDTTKKQEIRNWYIEKRPVFKKLTSKIESILIELIEESDINIHNIYSRTKDIDSFDTKISKKSYKEPKNEIHDLTGIRIITYVESDVEIISSIVKKSFKIDIKNSINKKMELGIDRVGYQSVHFVAELKNDRLKLPEYKKFKNMKFEVQIRTILQHAWAEIEHDRNYKFSGQLPEEIKRRFTVLAGALELADREFNSIANTIDNISSQVEEGNKTGQLNIEINSTTLNSYLKNRLSKYLENGSIEDSRDKHEEIEMIANLNTLNIKTLDNLDGIIEENYIEKFIENIREPRNYFDFISNLLLYKFSKTFFQSIDQDFYDGIFIDELELHKALGVPIDDIIRKNNIEILKST